MLKLMLKMQETLEYFIRKCQLFFFQSKYSKLGTSMFFIIIIQSILVQHFKKYVTNIQSIKFSNHQLLLLYMY